jgi:hypothetical protein
VVLHQYPAAQVEYRFKCRTPGIDLVAYIEEIRAELKALCRLRFAPGEMPPRFDPDAAPRLPAGTRPAGRLTSPAGAATALHQVPSGHARTAAMPRPVLAGGKRGLR